MKKFKARKDRREKGGPKKILIKNAPKSRKELRKEKRKLKKIHKNDYFSKKIKNNESEVGKFVKAPVHDEDYVNNIEKSPKKPVRIESI